MPAAGARVGVALLFALYLAVLVWTVLWKLHLPYVGSGGMRVIKLVPFAAGGGFGASAPVEVLQNIVVFVPFGIGLRLLARSWSGWRIVGVVAGASLALEIAQYVLAVGRSDATDVLTNAFGGAAGVALVVLARAGEVSPRPSPAGAPRR